MDRWDGFAYVVFASIILPFAPFLVSLFGRDLRWKGAALGLGLATLFAVGFESLMFVSWIGAWIAAVLAFRKPSVLRERVQKEK